MNLLLPYCVRPHVHQSTENLNCDRQPLPTARLLWLSHSMLMIAPACTNFNRGSEPGCDGTGCPRIILVCLIPARYVFILAGAMPSLAKAAIHRQSINSLTGNG